MNKFFGFLKKIPWGKIDRRVWAGLAILTIIVFLNAFGGKKSGQLSMSDIEAAASQTVEAQQGKRAAMPLPLGFTPEAQQLQPTAALTLTGDITVVYPGKTAAIKEIGQDKADWDLSNNGDLSNYFLVMVLVSEGRDYQSAIDEVWDTATPGKVWCVYKLLMKDKNSSLYLAIADWSTKVGDKYPNLDKSYEIVVPRSALSCMH